LPFLNELEAGMEEAEDTLSTPSILGAQAVEELAELFDPQRQHRCERK
jgi:hypothetical protein